MRAIAAPWARAEKSSPSGAGLSAWGEPKVAFRMAGIDEDHLAEFVTEAWRVQAPKYLPLELDDVGS